MSTEILGGTGPESNTSLACVSCRPTAAILLQPYDRVASVTQLGVPDLSRTQLRLNTALKIFKTPRRYLGKRRFNKRKNIWAHLYLKEEVYIHTYIYMYTQIFI